MNKKSKEIEEKLTLLTETPEWQKLRVSGDVTAIAQVGKVSPTLVSRAIITGKGSVKTLRIIKAYFDRRKQFLENSKALGNETEANNND